MIQPKISQARESPKKRKREIKKEGQVKFPETLIVSVISNYISSRDRFPDNEKLRCHENNIAELDDLELTLRKEFSEFTRQIYEEEKDDLKALEKVNRAQIELTISNQRIEADRENEKKKLSGMILHKENWYKDQSEIYFDQLKETVREMSEK